MTSPPTWKRSWTKSPPASWTGRQLLRDFWTEFSAAVGETKDLKITRRHRRAGRRAGAAHLPARRRRRRSAQMPVLRRRPAEPEAGPVRRLYRLHQLSGLQIHPPDRRQAGRRRCRPGGDRASIPKRRGQITLRTGRFGPYVQRGEGDKPKRSGLPKGTDKCRCRSGAGAEAAGAAARSRPASRRRQEDHRQFRPLRALCGA